MDTTDGRALVLIMGPPGCGKTTLARTVAGQAQLSLVTTEDIRARLLSEGNVTEDRDFTPDIRHL